jgi:hypothetical protein
MQSVSLKRSISVVLVALVCSTATAELWAPSSNAAVTKPKLQRKRVADKLARKAEQVATRMDTVGWCFAGVKQALQSVGVALYGAAAWMAAPQLKQDARFHVVDNASLQKGDIMVHGRSPAHPYGHIAVYLGNGKEASDHVQKVVLGGRYGKTEVFRPGHGSAKTSLIAHVSNRTKSLNRTRLGTAPTAVVAEAKQVSTPQAVAKKPAPAVPDASTIAAAQTEANKFAYLYSQGAVSRADAEQRVLRLKTLQAQVPTHAGEKLAVAGARTDRADN